jgi:hypothetical protein
MLLSNYTAMHVMVTARRFWSLMKAGAGNAAQAWCRVASAIKKNVPRRASCALRGRENHE